MIMGLFRREMAPGERERDKGALQDKWTTGGRPKGSASRRAGQAHKDLRQAAQAQQAAADEETKQRRLRGALTGGETFSARERRKNREAARAERQRVKDRNQMIKDLRAQGMSRRKAIQQANATYGP